jgi:hypothetical protein
MARQRGTPVLISEGNARSTLDRIRLGDGLHDESWLQGLIHDHPATLPMSDIEPGFGDLIAVAREIPCGHGYIDNLYLTPSGDIVLVETKLWRNSQMRREVVAQALDYVAALSHMTYDAFEAAAVRGQQAAAHLYDIVRDHPEALEEAKFIDAVTLNLRRGRMVAMVLGDGIRTETEALSDLLQSHAGAHFTFALVELATWRTPGGDILAVPSTLAKTVMIERGIVRVDDGVATVRPVHAVARTGPQSISSADFWDMMAKRERSLPAAIRSFLTALEPLGVYAEIKNSLNLKLDLAECDKPINFGYIMKNGTFWPNPASWTLPEAIWRTYFEALAQMVGGIVIDEPNNKYVAVRGRSGPRIDQFLPHHQQAWVTAIDQAIRAVHSFHIHGSV